MHPTKPRVPLSHASHCNHLFSQHFAQNSQPNWLDWENPRPGSKSKSSLENSYSHMVVERLWNVLAGLTIKEQMPEVYIRHVSYRSPAKKSIMQTKLPTRGQIWKGNKHLEESKHLCEEEQKKSSSAFACCCHRSLELQKRFILFSFSYDYFRKVWNVFSGELYSG